MLRIKIVNKLIFFTFVLANFFGCEKIDERPRFSSDSTPFSVANLYVGMEKKTAESIADLGSCMHSNEVTIECITYPANQGKRILFMSSDIDQITYAFDSNSSEISSIKFDVLGHNIGRYSIESKWNLKERCLDYSSLEQVRSWSIEGEIAVKHIQDWGVSPVDYGDFICMSDQGRFVAIYQREYNQKKYTRINIFHIAQVPKSFVDRVLAINKVIGSKNRVLNANVKWYYLDFDASEDLNDDLCVELDKGVTPAESLTLFVGDDGFMESASHTFPDGSRMVVFTTKENSNFAYVNNLGNCLNLRNAITKTAKEPLYFLGDCSTPKYAGSVEFEVATAKANFGSDNVELIFRTHESALIKVRNSNGEEFSVFMTSSQKECYGRQISLNEGE